MHGTVLPTFDPKDVEDHKLMAALSYVGVLCFVPLIFMKRSRYAQENAKQGVVLLLAWIVGMLVFWFPLFGQLAWIVLLIVDVVAFLKCLNGEFWEIPIIGQYRSKVNL